jgi:hypothetical protein
MLANQIIFYKHVGDIHDYFWFMDNESIRGLSLQMLCCAFFHSTC